MKTKFVRHFLTLLDLSPQECNTLIERAIELKKAHKACKSSEPSCQQLKNKVLGLIFEKSSTRTRVSFEAAMMQSGGGSLFLSPRDTQFGRGEPTEDSARVLSRMLDIIAIRTFEHQRLEKFAKYSSVPVINALTDDYHPCQLLADMQTYYEHKGSIAGNIVAWIGDGNNMCQSYINAAKQFDFQLNIACPKGFEPNQHLIATNKNRVHLCHDPVTAVKEAKLIATDVWTSMGQEEEQNIRLKTFASFQVTPKLLDQADNDVIFMHCLPAHRGEEVSALTLEDSRSVIWDEAENRLHAQKALLEFLLKSTQA